jgi:hypothetical protein
MTALDGAIMRRFGPLLVTVPFLATIFAMYARQFVPFGAGILGGVFVGVLWALLLGGLASGLARWSGWRTGLANTPVFLAIAATGLMIGGGYMYASMMNEALAEPTLTYAVLGALMQPAVPFYIVLNSALELVLIALTVHWNWRVGSTRRSLLLAGAAAYFAVRVWTYLVYAENRLEITQHTLSDADVSWFQQTLATDFRIWLNAVVFVCFLLAAFIPPFGLTASRSILSGDRLPARRGSYEAEGSIA